MRLALVTSLVLLLSIGARADDTYERKQVEAAATQLGLELVKPPPSARIAFIEVVRSEVFSDDDPFPQWFNWFHWLSTEETVKRELLFEEGDPFTDKLDESTRNLRRRGVFQAVRVEPARDSGGRYGVVVFTRDLWSLRAEQSFQLTGTTLDRLLLQITERNLFGRHELGSLRLQVAPRIFSIGQIYFDRRVLNSDFSLFEQGDVIFNQATGAPEGVEGNAVLGWPLYDFKRPWGADLIVDGRARPIRQVQGSQVLTYDAPDTPEVERIDRAWDERQLLVQARVRRQFGSRFKHRIALGFAASFQDRQPRFGDEVSSVAREAFVRDVLPRSRDQVFPFLAYHGFTPKFRRFTNLDTFAREEPVRLGPALAVTMGAGSRALLSSSDFLFVTAGAALSEDFFGDGLAELAFDLAARLEDNEVVDRIFRTRMRLATPQTGLGRLTLRVDTSFLNNDSQNRLVSIGGDSGLRGTASQAFFVFGGSSARATAEWRAPPFVVQTVHFGLVGFWDAGDVFVDLDDFSPKHSVGVGVRLLFPQFNLLPYRIDLGIPLDGGGFNILLSFGDIPVVLHGQAAVTRLHPVP